MNIRNISGMLLCCKKKSQLLSRRRKPNCKQERYLFCGFVAKSCVLIFAVIGHNTINIPEIFQAFTVSWSHYKQPSSLDTLSLTLF